MAKILLEGGLDYQVVFPKEELLAKYDCIIVPNGTRPDPEFKEKLTEFAREHVLVLLGDAIQHFDLGIKYIGKSDCDVDYIHCSNGISKQTISTPLLCNESCHRVFAERGIVLARIHEPYFNRTYAHYCGHKNTPNKTEPAEYPGIVRVENVLYFAHDFGVLYGRYGSFYHRDIFLTALKEVYEPTVCVNGLMSGGRVRLLEDEQAYYLHLLYALPLQRGEGLILEDFPQLNHLIIRLRCNVRIQSVLLQPQNQALPFLQEGNNVRLHLKKLRSHQVIELKKC